MTQMNIIINLNTGTMVVQGEDARGVKSNVDTRGSIGGKTVWYYRYY